MTGKPTLPGHGFIATGNAGKLREIIPLCEEYFLSEGKAEGLAPDGAVESAETFEGNALIKARYLKDILLSRNTPFPFWILADDSGISVDHLGGRPGVRSARYAGDHVAPDRHMQKLIEELKAAGKPAPHHAHYTCALALLRCDQKSEAETVAVGQCAGEIVFSPRGTTGFGYDPIFFVPGFGKTFAEVSYEEKNSVSHRRRAFQGLARALGVMLLLLGGAPLSFPTRAAPIAQVFGAWQEDGFLKLPDLPNDTAPSVAQPLAGSESSAAVKELLSFYASKLPGVEAAKIRWKQILLSAEFQLPGARAARPFFNTHLIQAFEGEKLLATFRPVDTSSGCNSGCAPINFHLLLRANAKNPEFFEEPGLPLTKKNHAPFTDADRKLLGDNLKSLPKLLKKLSSSAQTTDPSEQTWPVYRATLVPDAAYTSYRVYEAVFQMLETLGTPDQERRRDIEAASDVLGRAYRIRSLKESQALWKELVKKSWTSGEARSVEEFDTAVLGALVAWRFEENPKSSARTLAADFKTAHLESLPAFQCQVIETLLLDASRARLKGIDSKILHACADLRAEWIEILSRDVLDARLVEVLKQKASRLPDFLLRRPELIAGIASKIPASEPLLRKEYYSLLKAEHPRFDLAAGLADPVRVSSLEEALKVRSLAAMTTAPLGTLPEATLAKFKGRAKFPVKGKEIYIFFASWCPHCKHLLETLRQELKDDDGLWKKIQLLESFSNSESLFEAQLLCASVKLPKSSCDEMLLWPSPRSDAALNRSLGLNGIPRIVITDAGGRIRDFDFHFEEGLSRDPLRKLRWELEQSK